jgi:hypothetical protein
MQPDPITPQSAGPLPEAIGDNMDVEVMERGEIFFDG